MFNNIIYVLATSSLLTGSILTFDYKIPDYFYLCGTSLFLIKSIISFIQEYKKQREMKKIYDFI